MASHEISTPRTKDKKVLNIYERIKRAKEGTEDPSSWSRSVKRAVVWYFQTVQPEATNHQIGEVLQLSGQRIGQLKRENLKDQAWQITDIDVASKALDFQVKMEACFRRAMTLNRPGEAAKIAVDAIKGLQSMGFLYRAPTEMRIQAAMLAKLEATIEDKGTVGIAQVFEILTGGENGRKRLAPGKKIHEVINIPAVAEDGE